jgi:hypothetical protein
MATESFIISPSGNWPNEVYNIKMNPDIINPDLNSLNAENKFKYFNQPIVDVDTPNISGSYSFINSDYELDKILNQMILNFDDTSSLVWTPSSIRKYNNGSFFNYFTLQQNINSDDILDTDTVDLNFSYLIYPYKLFLKPISARKISSNNYELVTSAVLISSCNFNFISFDAEREAFDKHVSNKSSTQKFINLPKNINLNYSISGVEHFAQKNIIYFTPPPAYYNPLKYVTILGKPNSFIRPDTLMAGYNVQFSPNETAPENIIIAQLYMEEYGANNGFGASFILKNKQNNITTLQFAQSSMHQYYELNSSINCILSCDINLKTTSFKYYNHTTVNKSGNLVATVSGVPDTSLSLRYICNTPYLDDESTHSTINSFVVDGSTIATNKLSSVNVSLLNASTTKSTWYTKYPPHYYSYILSFNSNELGYSQNSETNNLVFYLSSGTTNLNTFSAKFLNKLCSDYNTLSLDLSTYAEKDVFKLTPMYTIADDKSFFSTLISSFSCFYSPDDKKYYNYNLHDKPWIPANSATNFKVYYNAEFGEIDLTLRASLSTSIGSTIDSFDVSRFKFARGYKQQPIGSIYLKRLNEKQNFVDLTIKHINNTQIYPYKDLTNSDISWNITPFSNNYVINSIDSNSKFIKNIIPNSAIKFDSNTSTVRISGYGPESILVTLSSKKYDQISQIQTDESLFNVYSDKKFLLELRKPVSNLADSKKIQLSACLLYNNKKYTLPATLPIYWTWTYDNLSNPKVIPITATDLTNKVYNFGEKNFAFNLSSLDVTIKDLIDPNKTTNKGTPLKHLISVYAYSNITYPPISAVYNYIYEAVPSKQVFNTDFSVLYDVFPNENVISNTRNGQYVLTRPNSDTNYFKFYANSDILPKIKADSFYWKAVSDDGTTKTLASNKFSDIATFTLQLVNPNIRTTTVTLCAIGATVPNWSVKQNTKTEFVIYTEDYNEFYKKLEFIVIPPYTWGLSGKYIKLLNKNDYTLTQTYTLAQGPTAYRNKRSKTQGFYISATKTTGYSEYQIYTGPEKTYVGELSSKLGYLEFKYRTEFFQKTGLLINMLAVGPKYPEYNGLAYTTTIPYEFVTRNFEITAKTIPYGSTLNKNVTSKFTQSPYLKPYDTITIKFSSQTLSSFDLDENRIITIDQYFVGSGGKDLSAQPTQQIQKILSGVYLVYTLSSALWKTYQYVPALKGTYDLFILSVGDPAVPLNVSKYKLNDLNLSVSGNMIMQIPPQTFDLYPTQPLTANLVAFWRFNELSGTRYDATGHGFDLKVVSSPQVSSIPLSSIGLIGKSLSAVSGVYLQTSGFDLGSNWTISYWEKLEVDPKSNRKNNFITKSSNGSSVDPLSGITISTAPVILYDNAPKYNQAILYNGPFVTQSKWNHIVFSATNKFLSVYLNNILIADEIYLSDALVDYIKSSNGHPFRINGLPMPVSVDAMGVWSRGLKSADVFNLYNAGSGIEHPFDTIIDFYDGERDLWDIVKQPVSAGPISFVAYSTTVMPEVYLSTYFALTGQPIYVQYETPENTQNVYISSYKTNFGENSGITIYSTASATVEYIYSTPGVYNISFEVTYNTGQVKNLSLESPITIYEEWPKYDQRKIRLLNETVLSFGNESENTYTLDQINIQPNEFGDVDIFNTAIERLYSNFEYLRFNSQTIKSTAPTLFYGWLGVESNNTARGIQWNTMDYGLFEWNKPYLATSIPKNSFKNIKAISEVERHILVIDDTKIRAFSAGKIPMELTFENWSDVSPLIPNPVSIDSFTDDSGHYAYVADSLRNRVYKFNLDLSYVPQINIQLGIGGLGSKDDPNKFNSPTDVTYSNDYVYVLDYGNKCVKQYTSDLNWAHTFYTNDFESYEPESVIVHPDKNVSFVYILTNNNRIYVFDQFSSDYFQIIEVFESNDASNTLKISFDESGEFIYVLTGKGIYKYSSTGIFVGNVDIPNSADLIYTDIQRSDFRSLLISTKNSILKIQDIVQMFSVGEGLEQKFWTRDQLKLNREEFSEDINYNRSLLRLVQNIKNYRDIIDSKFVIVTEQLPSGTVSYYTLTPISTEDRPTFSDYIENEDIGIAVNEFHIPQVLNREFKKIYDALDLLRNYLTVSDARVQSGVNKGCFSLFCWSWKAMSCYNLSLPVIRICNINPITYSELEDDFPIKYSPSTKWGMASSQCCNEFNSSLNPLYKT